jgi:hypothetical protein
METLTVRLRPDKAGTSDPGRSNGRSAATAVGLAEIAVPRLRNLALILTGLAGLLALGAIAEKTGWVDVRIPIHSTFQLVIVTLAFVASAAMVAITRSGWPAVRIANVGILFQIVGALCISLIEEQTARLTGASLVAIWIMTFTLVPQAPRRAALAAFGAASTSVIGIGVNVVFEHRAHALAGADLQVVVVGNFICATIALFTNQVIYRLGREIQDVKQLGNYNIVKQLGAGGMGEVWHAEHRALIRPAAIKLMRPDLMRGLSRAEVEALRARFEYEVQATALLTSPHTVAVYDFGSTEDHRLYYVMELLHGLDTESLVKQYGPLEPERVVHLLRQACESLGEAHATGLVHRDVKPANLYLCMIGQQLDFVKVLDFGLVRDLAAGVRMTGDGVIAGTPAYLAPETAAKNITDARSDIYSLGCVAYYMLTGQLVFDAETSASMMAAHLRDQATPPSKRTETAIPPELDALVVACLSKDPEERPQSMEELRARLDAIQFDRPWTDERATRWWTLHQPEVIREATMIKAGARA